MPQGRRKVAFSGKKKKAQIQAHRAKRKGHENGEGGDDYNTHTASFGEATIASAQQDVSVNYHEEVLALSQQPGANTTVNRYNLKFRRETADQKEKRKRLHHKNVILLPESELETSAESFYPPGLSYPSRPYWKKNMSKCELDMSENRHFRLFCERTDREFSGRDLSMYELNLETWRQLWRVTEMSDILLIIVDARFPVAQFPAYLYEHLVEKENKGVILILNKCDLLPPSVIFAWELYFSQTFPKLLVVPFSSVEGVKAKRTLLKMAAESALGLVDACQSLVEDSVNLKSWRNKIEEERDQEHVNEACEVTETNLVAAQSTVPELYQRYRDGVLTIGTIGHPNVGKSSLINALMGKKVVSVSKTPGHTKHFQTIFLTKDIKLCDCPGLVFPSTVEVPLQVLLGSFPIAQLRDPISVVQYVAARIDIPHLLKLRHSEEDMDSSEWTSYLICEAWAIKRGYRTRKRGMADVSRAANELLRLCLNGQKSLILFMRPPGYINDKEKLECDPHIEKIKLIQGFHASPNIEDNTQRFHESHNIEDNIQGEENNEESFEDDEEFGSEEEEEEVVKPEAKESESEDDFCPATSTQNKFALLPDED